MKLITGSRIKEAKNGEYVTGQPRIFATATALPVNLRYDPPAVTGAEVFFCVPTGTLIGSKLVFAEVGQR